MSEPIRHHFLPKHAFLRFFESYENESFIWMYQRGKEPILVNTDKIAKEKHLYSFVDESGKYNPELEKIFAEMESVASTVLEKLNSAIGPISISMQEKFDLAYFISMQFARTPAFRDSLKKQAAEFARLNMQVLASNKEALANAIKETRKENPAMPDKSVEEMQEFILGGEYEIEMTGKNYFLKQAVQLGDALYPTIMMKDIIILKSDSTELITSDYPVNLVPDPSIPPIYGGGFLMSGVLFPIGTNTALFLKNPRNPKERMENKDPMQRIEYKNIPAAHGRWINKVTLNYAERFLFATSLDLKIKELFDQTKEPKRFSVSSPFSNKKN